MEISSLLRKETSALFLVEEDDCLKWKSLRPRRRDCRRSIGTAQLDRVPGRFDLRERAPIEENQEPEAGSLEGLALSNPRIGSRSRRIIQPIAGIGEVRRRIFKFESPG